MSAEALTWEEFARLRTEAQRRWAASIGGSTRSWPPGHVAVAFLDRIRPVTAPAGSWFLPWPGYPTATRWHLSTGDLAWQPAWTFVKVVAACSWASEIGPRGVWADEPGEPGPCRRCLAAARRVHDA